MRGKSGFLAIVTVGVVFTAAAVEAQTPRSALVTVVNPPSAPVPVTIQGGSVTGEVVVTNTPSVTVGNEVAVRVVGEPAESPYWVDEHLTLPSTASSIEMPFEMVPAGRRVVLEYVSIYCSTRTDESLLDIGLHVMGTGPDGVSKSMGYHFAVQKAVGDYGGLSRWHGSQPIRLYADPGEIRFNASRTLVAGGDDFWSCDVALSGRSVPIP